MRERWMRLIGVTDVVEQTPLRLLLFLAMVTWFFAEPLLAADAIGNWFDHRFFYNITEITRKIIVEQGALPLWNPYSCGGIPHLGNPTVALFVPTLPLPLVFGAAVGVKLTIVAMLVVGAEGSYRLARHIGARPVASLIAGATFPLCGTMAHWLRTGQDFLGVELLPWVMLMTLRAYAGERRAILW